MKPRAPLFSIVASLFTLLLTPQFSQANCDALFGNPTQLGSRDAATPQSRQLLVKKLKKTGEYVRLDLNKWGSSEDPAAFPEVISTVQQYSEYITKDPTPVSRWGRFRRRHLDTLYSSRSRYLTRVVEKMTDQQVALSLLRIELKELLEKESPINSYDSGINLNLWKTKFTEMKEVETADPLAIAKAIKAEDLEILILRFKFVLKLRRWQDQEFTFSADYIQDDSPTHVRIRVKFPEFKEVETPPEKGERHDLHAMIGLMSLDQLQSALER